MEILLARRPVLGRDDVVVGYELGYEEPDTDGGAGGSTNRSRYLVVDVFLGLGLETVTRGRPAFLPVSRELLQSGYLELLDAERMVLMVSDVSATDARTLAACERLVTAGFRLAFDARVLETEAAAAAILPLAELVWVDVAEGVDEGRSLALARSDRSPVRMLALNVPSNELHERCKRLGFELFTGPFVTRPDTLTQRDAGVDYLLTFRLLQRIRDPKVTDAEIEEAFRLDLSLSYKLMRMANSAAVGARGVRSIAHAIKLLGRESLYRWVAFLLLSSTAERDVEFEVVRASLVRGRVCEGLAGPIGRPAAAGSLYIMGLMSQLDTLLGRPMEELARDMGLAPEVQAALVDGEGAHGAVLRLVEAYEQFRWGEVMDRCAELGIRPRVVGDRYVDALAWAARQFQLGA